MKRVTTKDNSTTFYNEEVQETYHSTSGAIEEAKEKHVFPSQILNRSKEKELTQVTILDFCFGLGYNSLVAYAHLRKEHPNKHIKILALENDSNIMLALQECDLDKEYKHAQQLFCQAIQEFENTKNPLQKIDEYCTIQFFLKDAKKSIEHIPTESVDVVFFDAFSPKKMPEMWTAEIFKKIYQTMKTGATLTTYSCARCVRDALKEAQFTVIDGPCVGRKSPSTIAIKVNKQTSSQ